MNLNHKSPDPVYQVDGDWYFLDETWSYSHGPYSSEFAAHLAMQYYVKIYLT